MAAIIKLEALLVYPDFVSNNGVLPLSNLNSGISVSFLTFIFPDKVVAFKLPIPIGFKFRSLKKSSLMVNQKL